jgi:hypothetical protein
MSLISKAFNPDGILSRDNGNFSRAPKVNPVGAVWLPIFPFVQNVHQAPLHVTMEFGSGSNWDGRPHMSAVT